MAKGKYAEWISEEGLQTIRNHAAKGLTYEEMSKAMGINPSTLYEWVERFPEIAEAIKAGRAVSVTAIENKLFDMAIGGLEEETEVKEVRQSLVDGQMVTVEQYIKKTRKKLSPNVTAMIFFLKNRAGYRDNPEVDPNLDEGLKKAREILAEVPSAID